jgi:hypothetical protein
VLNVLMLVVVMYTGGFYVKSHSFYCQFVQNVAKICRNVD